MVAESGKNVGNTVKVENQKVESAEPARSRKLTVLKLQWVAERARKIERIRKAIDAGTYFVEAKDVARKLLNLDLLDEAKDEQADS